MGRIVLFGRKSGIWDILFKIYLVSKSIPATKFQNFVDASGPQKPMCTKFLKFDCFFYLKRQNFRYYHEKKSSWAHIIFIYKSYNEIQCQRGYWSSLANNNPAIFSFPPSSKKLTQADKKPWWFQCVAHI